MMKVVLCFAFVAGSLVYLYLQVESSQSELGVDRVSTPVMRARTGYSAGGCLSARDEVMGEAKEACESSGGVSWYAFEPYCSRAEGRWFAQLSFRCLQDDPERVR